MEIQVLTVATVDLKRAKLVSAAHPAEANLKEAVAATVVERRALAVNPTVVKDLAKDLMETRNLMEAKDLAKDLAAEDMDKV